jgi:hypothetical protein
MAFGRSAPTLRMPASPGRGSGGRARRGSTIDRQIPQHRQRALGLPLGRRLFGPEISQAYKQAAKKVHPDAGGSQHAFLELSAARDALMDAV